MRSQWRPIGWQLWRDGAKVEEYIIYPHQGLSENPDKPKYMMWRSFDEDLNVTEEAMIEDPRAWHYEVFNEYVKGTAKGEALDRMVYESTSDKPIGSGKGRTKAAEAEAKKKADEKAKAKEAKAKAKEAKAKALAKKKKKADAKAKAKNNAKSKAKATRKANAAPKGKANVKKEPSSSKGSSSSSSE